MHEGPEEREKCDIFQTVRSLKESVQKADAGEDSRHQILRTEGQPLKVFKQEMGG